MTDPTGGPVGGDDLALWARRAWAALETVHVPGYFSAPCREEYKALGLRPSLAYFPVRAAAMGPVPAEVVEATFYVFAPRLVRQVLPECWAIAAPAQVLRARHAGVAATLHGLLDPVLAELPDGQLSEAVDLARRACEGLSAPGRPLYAAHASLAWPADPLMQLWHASTLVREHRGDGHVAALVTAGISPLQAMLTYGLTGSGVSLTFLRRSRGWTDAEWDECGQLAVERGLVERVEGGVEDSGFALTDAGRRLRTDLESATDRSALVGWAHLGATGTRRLAELLRPLSKAVLASGALAAVQPAR